MKVNGEDRSWTGSMTVTDLLREEGYDSRVVVVERNLEIIPKETYDTTVLQPDDTIEIVQFMGGG